MEVEMGRYRKPQRRFIRGWVRVTSTDTRDDLGTFATYFSPYNYMYLLSNKSDIEFRAMKPAY